MNKTAAALRAGTTRTAAPAVTESLARRLRAMERQLSTISRIGGGLGSAEVENLSRDVCQMVSAARELEERRPKVENTAVLAACQLLFDAEGAINKAFGDLRERLHETDLDPDGSIVAAIQVGQELAAAAELVVAGRIAS